MRRVGEIWHARVPNREIGKRALTFAAKPFFKFFNGRQRVAQPNRQFLRRAVGRNTQGLAVISDRVFHIRPVRRLAKDDADGGVFVRLSHGIVQYLQIEIHLPEVNGLERTFFEFYRHERV